MFSSTVLTSGVIQGSVLGPLLFNSYVNDLPDVLNNSFCKMYADDVRALKLIATVPIPNFSLR